MVGSQWSEGHPLTSEVIDLSDENSICQGLPDAPYPAYRSTGGLVGMENLPLVCGLHINSAGNLNGHKCFILGKESWDTFNTINSRTGSSSIVINKQGRNYTINNITTETEC